MSRKMFKLIWYTLTYLVVLSQLAIPAYQIRAAYVTRHSSDDSFEFVTQEMVDANLALLSDLLPDTSEPEGEISVWDLLPESGGVSELELRNVELMQNPTSTPTPATSGFPPSCVPHPNSGNAICYATRVLDTFDDIDPQGDNSPLVNVQNILGLPDEQFTRITDFDDFNVWGNDTREISDCIALAFDGVIENHTAIRITTTGFQRGAAATDKSIFVHYSEDYLTCENYSSAPAANIQPSYSERNEWASHVDFLYQVTPINVRSIVVRTNMPSASIDAVAVEGTNFIPDADPYLMYILGSPPTGDESDYSVVDSDTLKQSLTFDGNVLPATGHYFYGVNDFAVRGDDMPLILRRQYSTEGHGRVGAFDFGYGWNHNFNTGLYWYGFEAENGGEDENIMGFLDTTGRHHTIFPDPDEAGSFEVVGGLLADFVRLPDGVYPTYPGYTGLGNGFSDVEYCLTLSDHTVYYFDESGYVRLIGNTINTINEDPDPINGDVDTYDPCSAEDNTFYRALVFDYEELATHPSASGVVLEQPVGYPTDETFTWRLLSAVTSGPNSLHFTYRSTPLGNLDPNPGNTSDDLRDHLYYADFVVIDQISLYHDGELLPHSTTCYTYDVVDSDFNMSNFMVQGESQPQADSISHICSNSDEHPSDPTSEELHVLRTATDVRGQTWQYSYGSISIAVRLNILNLRTNEPATPIDLYGVAYHVNGIFDPTGQVVEYMDYYCQTASWHPDTLPNSEGDIDCFRNTDPDATNINPLGVRGIYRHWNGEGQLMGEYDYGDEDTYSHTRTTTQIVDEEGILTEYGTANCSQATGNTCYLNRIMVASNQISLTLYEYVSVVNTVVWGIDHRVRPTRVTDINNNESEYQWVTDEDLYTLDIIYDPTDAPTSFIYDDYGNQRSVTDANNHTTTSAYNDIFPTMPDTITVPDVGNGTSEIIDYEIHQSGDDIGLLAWMQNADGTRTSYSFYNDQGLPGCIATIGNGVYQITGLSYNERGQVNQTISGLISCGSTYNGIVTDYVYDDAGNVTEVTENNQYTTRMVYDSAGRLEKVTDPSGRVVRYFYDAAGRVTSVHTPNPQATTDLLNTDGTDPLITRYSYNSQNSVTRVTDPYGRTNWTCYDGLQRPTLQIINIDMQGQTDVEATYQGVCNLSTPLPLTQTDIHNLTTTITYDNGSENNHPGIEIVTVTDPSGIETVTYKDHMGREIAVVYNWVDGTHDFEYPDQDIIVWTRYDAVGNVEEVIDLHFWNDDINYTIDDYDQSGEIDYDDTSNSLTRSTRYCYNARNQMIRQIANWNSSTYSDPCNTLPASNAHGTYNDRNLVTDYGYDPMGNMTAVVVNPESSTERRETRYEYDGLGRVREVIQNYTTSGFNPTSPDLHLITEYRYDHRGNLVQEREVRGTQHWCTTYEYDNLGRQTSVTYNNTRYPFYCTNRASETPDSDLNITYHTVYDEVGRVTSQRDPYGLTTEFTYDSLDRIRTVTDPRQLTTTTNYLPNPPSSTEHLWEITTSSAGISQSSYLDHLDRQVRSTSPEGHPMNYTYDIRGQVLSATDPSGRNTVYDYDALGQITCLNENASSPTATCTSSGVFTQYNYDSNGNLIEVILPNGGIIDYIYDALGRRIYTDGPLVESLLTTDPPVFDVIDVSRVRYDLLGRPFEITDPNELAISNEGHTQQITYNALNQVEDVTYSDNRTVDYQYNQFNQVVAINDTINSATTTTSYSYDLMNRVTNVNDPLGQNVSYQYDQIGRRTNVTFPGQSGNQSVNYDYSQYTSGQINVNDWGGNQTQYRFDDLNQLTGMTLPNGIVVSYAYTPDGQTETITYTQNNNIVAQYDYQYDDVGNRIVAYEQIARSLTGPGYYNATEDNFLPIGVWVSTVDGNAINGNSFQTTAIGDSLNFSVDADYAEGISIFVTQDPSAGSIEICINGNCADSIDLSNPTRVNGYEIIVDLTDPDFLLTGNEETLDISIRLASGSWIGIEAIRISGPLPPGYYDDAPASSGFNITYDGWFHIADPTARDNTISEADNTSGPITFSVIPDDINGFAIYHESSATVIDVRLNVCNYSAVRCSTIELYKPFSTLYGNRFYISNEDLALTGSDPVTITISRSGPPPWEDTGNRVSFDGVLILPADGQMTNLPQATVPITNIAVDQSVRRVGSWFYETATASELGNGSSWAGEAGWSAIDPTGALLFGFEGQGIDISYYVDHVGNAGLASHFEVCIDDNCSVVSMQNHANLPHTTYGNHAYIYADSPGYHVVEIRNVISNKWIGIESITIIDERPVLGAGLYADFTHQGIALDGLWKDNDLSNRVNGTAITSTGVAVYDYIPGTTIVYDRTGNEFAYISFAVDASQADQLVFWATLTDKNSGVKVCYDADNDGSFSELGIVDPDDTCTFRSTFLPPPVYVTDLHNQPLEIDLLQDLGLTSSDTNASINVQVTLFDENSIELEAIQLFQDGPLTPGYYDQTPWGSELKIEYDANWTLYSSSATGNDQPRDGSYTLTNVTDAEATFEIIPDDVEGIALYILTYTGGSTFQLCSPNICQDVVTGPLARADGVRRYVDLESFNLSGTMPVTFTIRNNIPGNYIVLEGIHVVAADADESNLPLLTETTTIPTPDNLRHVSDWFPYSNGSNTGWFTNSRSGSLMFTFYGTGLDIERYMDSTYANRIFEVCIDGDDCQIMGQRLNSGGEFGHHYYIYAEDIGYHTVEIRSMASTTIGGIESITVLDTPQPVLGEGSYKLDHPGIIQDGEWVPYLNDSFYTTVDNHELHFLVDTSETDAIAIFASADSTTGNIDVCGIQLQPECVTLDPNASNLGILTVEPDWDSLGNPDTVEITLRYDKAGSNWLNIGTIQIIQRGPLQPGYYDVHPSDHDFNIRFEGAWILQSNPSLRDNTVYYGDAGTAQFEVIPADVQGIILYAQYFTGADLIRLCNGAYCDEYSTNFPSQLGVPIPIDISASGLNLGNGTDPVTLTLSSSISGDGSWIGWEGIHIVAARPEESNLPLLTQEITVLLEDETIRRISDWSEVDNASLDYGGYIQPTYVAPNYDPASSLMFTIYGTGIELIHYAANASGNHPEGEICIDGDLCRIFESETDTTNPIFGNTTVVFAETPGYHTVEIRTTSTQGIFPEAIRVLTDPQPILGAGLYQETADHQLAIYGRWLVYNEGTMNGSNGIYSLQDDDEIRFFVDTTEMEQLVVHYSGGSASDLQLCVQDICSIEDLPGTSRDSTFVFTPNWSDYGNPSVAEISLSTVFFPSTWLSIEAIEIRDEVGVPEQSAPESAPFTIDPGIIVIDEPVVEVADPIVIEPLAPATLPFYEPFDTNTDWTASISDWIYQTDGSFNGAGWTVDTTARTPFAMLEFDRGIDLTTATAPQLSWLQSADLSSTDIAAVDIRLDGETDWTIVYDETALDTTWQQQFVDLTPYIGNLIHVRFRLTAIGDVPNGEASSFFSVDDVRIEEVVVVVDPVTIEPTAIDIVTATSTPSATITETVVVTEETITATVTPSATITETSVVTDEPTVTTTPSATITETPSATVTPIPTNPVTLQILSPTSGQVITQTDETRFEAIAFDTRTGTNNGANIAYVTFRIYDSAGQLVYERIEDIVRYCAGWGDASCNTLNFLLNQSGSYTLTAQATTNDGLLSDIATTTFTVMGTSATQPAIVTTTPIAIPTEAVDGLPFHEPFDTTNAWTSTTWSQTANGYVGTGVFVDTSDRSQNNPAIVYTDSIDLTGATTPQLTWWQWADLSNSDVVQVHIQVEGENGWTRIYREADLNTDWSQASLDLSAYAGQSIRLRFRVRLNGNVPNGQTSIGYAIDELWITDAVSTLPTATTQADFVIPAPSIQITPSATPTVESTMTATPSATITPSETATPVEETRFDDNIRARALVPEPAQIVIPPAPPVEIPVLDHHDVVRQTIHYGYDELNRLTCANYYEGIITPPSDCDSMDVTASNSFIYGYDVMGNREDQYAYTNGSLDHHYHYNYNIANQLTDLNDGGWINSIGFTYDHNGNLEQMNGFLVGLGITNYTYNAANQMTGITSPSGSYTYTYDAMGNRYGQTDVTNNITTNYVLDTMGGLTQVLREHSTLNDRSYLNGLTSIGELNSAGAWVYYGTDALGSIRNTFTNSVPSAFTNTFDPYGNPIQSVQLSSFGFTGEYTDPTGLQHLRARYYNPELGIFTQQDPVQGIVGGSASMYWNPYGYAGGNPVGLADPYGLSPCPTSGEGAYLCDMAFDTIGQGFEAISLFFTGRASEDARTLASETHGPILESAGHIAIGAAGIAFMAATAFAMPYAFAAYIIYAGTHTVVRDYLDQENTPSWLKSLRPIIDGVGILTGATFIREDIHTILDPNTSWNRRVSTIGSVGFNMAFGTAQFSGIGHSYQSTRLASRLKDVDNAQDRLNVIRQFVSEYTGFNNVTVELSDTISDFYRPLRTYTIQINPRHIGRSPSYLAGNVMHESMHMLQEFRYGNNAMRGLLNWSVRAGESRNFPNWVMGYLLNPVEIGARSAGLLSLSINLFADPILRSLQGTIYHIR